MSDLPISQRKFDRLPEFDERSRGYAIRTIIRETPRSALWLSGHGELDTAPTMAEAATWVPDPLPLDQGPDGACVGYGWSAELAVDPIPVGGISNTFATSIYHRAQYLDEFPNTPPEEGSSVIAGAKVCQQDGYVTEYRWGFSIADVLLALGNHGPVVFGIPWLTRMDNPRANGMLDCTGGVAGGHCICGVGVFLDYTIEGERPANYVVVLQSWGNWGPYNGLALIREDQMWQHLLKKDGESCVPVVRKDPYITTATP